MLAKCTVFRIKVSVLFLYLKYSFFPFATSVALCSWRHVHISGHGSLWYDMSQCTSSSLSLGCPLPTLFAQILLLILQYTAWSSCPCPCVLMGLCSKAPAWWDAIYTWIVNSICIIHLPHDVQLFECRACAPVHPNMSGALTPGTLSDAWWLHELEEEDRKPEGKTTDISRWLLEVLRNLGPFTVEKYQ